MNPPDVRMSKIPFVACVVVGVIFVPLVLALIVRGLSDGFNGLPIALAAAVLAMSAMLFWIVRRGHLRSVKQFSSRGLLRHDGRTLPWTELNRVVDQVRLRRWGRKALWRTEIHFDNGESAWLVPNKITNFEEVYAFTRTLPCERSEVGVGTQ